jgi:chromosome condensin MukBEF complex kleisin-like MukF subunit
MFRVKSFRFSAKVSTCAKNVKIAAKAATKGLSEIRWKNFEACIRVVIRFFPSKHLSPIQRGVFGLCEYEADY